MNLLLAKIYRTLLRLAFKYRLGKRPWSARILFFAMSLLENYEQYVNTNDLGKNHHYVPQLILRRFRIAENGTDSGQTWAFSFESNRIEKVGISSAASAKDYYIFKDKSGQMSDFTEKRLFSHLLERYGSHVIKQINTSVGEPRLTFLEESTLASFVAFQITRVPAFRKAIEDYLVFAFEKKGLVIEDLGTHESMRRKIVQNGLNVSLYELLKHKTPIKIAGVSNHIGSLANQIANDISEKAYRRHLHFIDVPAGMDDRFVVSDNPVVLLDLERSEIRQYPAWWDIDKEDLWLLMPISPKRCILLCKSIRKGGRVENESSDLVQLVNFGQYLNATKSVYSSDLKYIQKHLRMYLKGLLSLRR